MLSAHMLGASRTVWIVFKTSSIHLPSLSFRHVQTFIQALSGHSLAHATSLLHDLPCGML